MWRREVEGGEWEDGAGEGKEGWGSWVGRGRGGGWEVVVKCRVLDTWDRRLKAALGWGHGRKQWDGAELLRRANVATGVPLVLARARIGGIVWEMLVLEFVPGPTVLEVLDQVARGEGPPVRVQHSIARAVGRQAGMFGCVIANRDYKPSNLVVVSADEEDATIAVIDSVGVFQPLMWRGVPGVLKTFVVEAMGCGVAPRRTLMARVVESAAPRMNVPKLPPVRFLQRPTQKLAREALQKRGPAQQIDRTMRWIRRWLWEQTTAAVRVHGDPRPRVDPLRGR